MLSINAGLAITSKEKLALMLLFVFTQNLGVKNSASSVHGHTVNSNPNSSLPQQPCTSFAMAPRKKRKMPSTDDDAKMKRTRSRSVILQVAD